MGTVILAEAFADSPLGATVIGVALTALVTVAVAMMRMVISVSVMARDIKEIRNDVEELKENPDIMRYSHMHEVGRMPAPSKRRQGGAR